MRPALLLLPVTAAVDIATVPFWLWALNKADEAEEHLFCPHLHSHTHEPSAKPYFFDDD